MSEGQTHRHGVSGWVGRWPVAAALAFLSLVYFHAFLLGGQHMVPFHLAQATVKEPARKDVLTKVLTPSITTGIPEADDQPQVSSDFSLSDTSPILIHYPNADFVGAALRRGELPLWNPYVGCGTPCLGNGQVFPFSAFLWPFYLHPTPWTYTAGLWVGCLFGFLGAYLWMDRFGWSGWQRLFGAAVWSFNPWTLKIFLFPNAWAFWWFGWLLWALDRVLDRPSRCWWLPAVMVACMVYGGHPEQALLMAAAAGLYALVAWCLPHEPEARRRWAVLAGGAGSAALAVVLAAVHAWPVLARLGECYSYKAAHSSGITLSHLPLDQIVDSSTPVYLSPLILGLAFAGIWASRFRRLFVPVLAVWAWGVLVGLRPVPLGPIHGLLSLGGFLPGLYANALLWCGLAVLAAEGAGALWGPEPSCRPARRLLLAGGLVHLVLYLSAFDPAALVPFRWGLMAAYGAGLALLAAGATLSAVRWKGWVLLVGLAGAACLPSFETEVWSRYFNRLSPSPEGIPAVRSFPGPTGSGAPRFTARAINSHNAPCLSPDLAAAFRMRDIRVVDALLLRRYADLEVMLRGRERDRYAGTWLNFKAARPEMRGLLGAAFEAVPDGAGPGSFRWEEIPGALPRAFLVHRVLPARNEQESLRRWYALGLRGELPKTAVAEGWEGPEAVGVAGPPEAVEWLEDGFSLVRVRVRSASGGFLVLLDSFAAGWKARVDGSDARLYAADAAFRGVALPPGEHEVSFAYRPAAVAWGLALSGAGWCLVAGLALACLRKMRREGAR